MTADNNDMTERGSYGLHKQPMTDANQQFVMFVQDRTDLAANLVSGLCHGKLDGLVEEVSEFYHAHPGLEEQIANGIYDITSQSTQDTAPEIPFNKTIDYLQHEMGVEPHLVLPILHVYMLHERSMRLFFHVATEQFRPEYRGNFEYMSIRRELERGCVEILSELGGIGRAQATQMIRNFEAVAKEICRDYMKEQGLLETAALSR